MDCIVIAAILFVLVAGIIYSIFMAIRANVVYDIRTQKINKLDINDLRMYDIHLEEYENLSWREMEKSYTKWRYKDFYKY